MKLMKLLILWLNVLAMGEIEWELTTGKKFALIKQLLWLWKKKKTLPKNYFCTLFLYFQEEGGE